MDSFRDRLKIKAIYHKLMFGFSRVVLAGCERHQQNKKYI